MNGRDVDAALYLKCDIKGPCVRGSTSTVGPINEVYFR